MLIGGCVELGEASLPYAPVVEALRGLGRELDPATLDELVGPGRPVLVRLLPELGQGEDRLEDPVGPRRRPGCSRRSSACWSASAERAPTVLVVEDLHWADRSTLDLLDVPRPQPAGRRCWSC